MACGRDTPNLSRLLPALLQRAVHQCRNRLAAHWNDRAAAWMARAEGPSASRRLDRAERLLGRAMRVTASPRARRLFSLNLSLLLQQRYELCDDPEAAAEAVTAARYSLGGLSPEDEWWCDGLRALADALLGVNSARTTAPSAENGTPARSAELDEAVDCMTRAVADAPHGSDDLPALIIRLGNVLEVLAASGADTDTLHKALGAARKAAAEAPDAGRAMARFALAEALCAVASVVGWTAAFDEGIDMYRAVARELPPDSGALHALGTACLLRDESEHDPEMAAEALRVLRRAVFVEARGTEERRLVEQDLGAALHVAYEHTGGPELLDEAAELLRTVVVGTPDGEPGLSLRKLRLAVVLDARATLTGETDDARAAVDLLTEELTDPSAGAEDEDRPGVLLNLANALLTLFELTGERGLVEQATDHLRTAAESPTSTVLRAQIDSSLSSALRTTFHHGGSSTDLADAVAAARRAVRSAGEGDAGLPDYSTNLAHALADQFEHTGAAELLDEAIAHARTAVVESAPGRPRRGETFSCLGLCLAAEYEVSKDLQVLRESVLHHREALRVTAAGDARRPGYLSNAATALCLLHEHTSDAEVLREAVETAREAVDSAADQDPGRHLYFQTFARVLRERHFSAHRSGEPCSGAHLRQAVAAGRHAVRALPLDAPAGASCRGNLAADLLLSHQEGLSGDDGDLTEALGLLCEEADALPRGTPERALSMYNLGLARLAMYERTRDRAELSQGLAAFRDAEQITAAAPMLRAEAALEWGVAAAAAQQWEAAVDGFGRALALLPLLPFARLDRGDQEYVLNVFADLGRDAAACLLACPDADPRRAVELLEQGRGVLLDAMLYPASEVAALQRVAPALASRFERLRERLDARRSHQGYRRSGGGAVRYLEGTLRQGSADSGKALSAELDEVVAEIRTLEGMERFARPATVEELLTESDTAQGPVVLINVSRHRSDALALTSDGVRVVPLPALTPDRLTRAVDHYLRILSALRAVDGPARPGGHRISERLADVCAWLWEAVAHPVLDALELGPCETDQPRLWWCPTGPLALLPLHAAQRYEARRGRDHGVIDRVISSYTPTLRALANARRPLPPETGSPDVGSQIMVAAVPKAPGLRPLTCVDEEIAAISGACVHAPVVLRDDDATREAVTRRMAHHRCWHFIGHSRQDLLNPGLAAIRLADGDLTALALTSLRLSDGELAFLSSCESATTGTGILDDPLHLALSCQIAGYRHTVGTMWSVGDSSAAELAGRFYERLTVDGRLACESTASALHAAVLDMRRTSPIEVWAAYLHAGA